ncbi:MAG: hypothetical protein OWQ57_01175 [Sulfobacillus sp.]|nr:hypothetical protein [Sulfobacillus sp.]
MKTVSRDKLVRWRWEDPDLAYTVARRRLRRSRMAQDGKLVILAMDHPGRGVTEAGGHPWAMADRLEVLDRLMAALAVPEVDGVLATPDVMEELLVYNALRVAAGEADVLDHRVLVGSINRAGLAQSVFERNDFMSSYTPSALVDFQLDAGKILVHLDLQHSETFSTLKMATDALNQLITYRLPVFLEVLPVPGNDSNQLVKAVGVATALGMSSWGRWLKLPMVEQFERVARATTCPIVLLGGGRSGGLDALTDNIRRCLSAGTNVRGVMIGRGLLFPDDGTDSVRAVQAIAHMVHA